LVAFNLVIENLEEDLSTGYVLHQLVTVLSQRTLAKAQKNPASKFQKLQNLNTALDALTKLEGVKLVNISAEDIINKNSKLDLGCTYQKKKKKHFSLFFFHPLIASFQEMHCNNNNFKNH
jgi:hypothetical protein